MSTKAIIEDERANCAFFLIRKSIHLRQHKTDEEEGRTNFKFRKWQNLPVVENTLDWKTALRHKKQKLKSDRDHVLSHQAIPMVQAVHRQKP